MLKDIQYKQMKIMATIREYAWEEEVKVQGYHFKQTYKYKICNVIPKVTTYTKIYLQKLHTHRKGNQTIPTQTTKYKRRHQEKKI